MTQALDDATRRVSRYLLMQFVVNACFGALCGIGLYFIGVPYAPLWAAVAGILRIVPYAGAIVSGLLPLDALTGRVRLMDASRCWCSCYSLRWS